MNMVKDLLTKEEQRYIKKILEILPEDAPVSYEVWAIGYYNKVITDMSFLLGSFTEPEFALEYTKTTAISDIRQIVTEADFSSVKLIPSINCITVEIETVIDDNDNGTINIGTIYKKTYVFKS